MTLTLQISYASTSSALSDRSVYANLFRTVPSDEPMAPALATLMQYYGWRQLSILTEGEPQFMKACYVTLSVKDQFKSINTTVSPDCEQSTFKFKRNQCKLHYNT